MNASDVAQELLTKNNILIVTHKNPDGDTLCSSAALCHALNECGKIAYLYRNSQISDKFLRFVGEYLAPEDFAPDYICSVDVAALDMLARDFEGHIDTCIDHHPTNIGFGDVNYICPQYAACGEIITDVIENMPCSISPDTATLLYIAVTTDCGAFMYANTNADTFDCCARLLRYGADFMLVNKVFFRKVSKNRLALEGKMLSNLEYYEDGKIVVNKITLDMMKESGTTDNDTDDIASLTGRVDSELIGITIREMDNNRCKISIRTSPGFSARNICAVFNGGGHEMAAGCSLDGSAESVKDKILKVALEELRNS